MTGYESKRAAARDKLDDDDDGKKAAQPAQKPVAHCEAGPEYCVQCKLENRSIVLAAAVRYVKNNTPQLVSDEICMALATPPQRPWVGLMRGARVEGDTVVIKVQSNNEARLLCSELVNEMGKNT